MPASYSSAAAALSLSPSLPPPDENDSASPPPPWTRPRAPSSASRRLSRYNLARTQSNQPLYMQALRTALSLARGAWEYYQRLPLAHRIALAAAALVTNVLGIVFLVYSHRIFAWLAPAAKGWRELPGGWVFVWLFAFATAFPPMIGYSTAVTISGFVWGFPLGWPIVASATVAGSTAAFLTSRGIFSGYVHRLVGADHRFVALGQVLRRDGLLVLAAVRLCPLPYSLSNGFLATIPSISPWAFAAGTAIASPKLLVHIFIGSRLAKLAEEGDSMSTGDKIINWTSMVVGGLIGLFVGWFVYKRTMARAAEIAREEAEEAGLAGEADGGSGRSGRLSAEGYADAEDAVALMDPDAAELMDDDDISLWEADEFDGTGGGARGYRDADDEGEERRENGNGVLNGRGK